MENVLLYRRDVIKIWLNKIIIPNFEFFLQSTRIINTISDSFFHSVNLCSTMEFKDALTQFGELHLHIGKQFDDLFTGARFQLQFDIEMALKKLSNERSLDINDVPLEQLIPRLY